MSGSRLLFVAAAALAAALLVSPLGGATTVPQPPPVAQDWSNTGLITTDDDWSGVPGIVGYRGDDLTTATGTDPQTLLADGSATPVDVNANQTNPSGFATGGVAEFHLANPVVALNGSGTADAPHLVLFLNTTGLASIAVSYNLRDLDGSADNAIQPVALHYRVGSSGSFTNVAAAYVADATTGPNLSTLVTPVNATLPAAVSNQPQVEVRVMMTNAVGNDEWVGVDDISVTGTPLASTGPTGIGSASPATVAAGASTLLTVAVTPGTNPPSTGIAVSGDLSSIGGSAAQQFFDDGTNGDAVAGDLTFSFQATVAAGTTPGAKTLPVTITDAQSRTGSASIGLTVEPPLVAIHSIQGASHISPLAGELVVTTGVVTARLGNGFYLQDPVPDADDATSEGVFVFTSSAPTVGVGDGVRVSGRVTEFRPGGASSTNLTTTEITSPAVTVLSSGNGLPAPTVLGNGGRVPPTVVIEDDASGSVETSGVFDPATDGIDFYESVEAMRVQVNDAVAVGPRNQFGEIPVVGDGSAFAGIDTIRGGVVIRPDDFNPERIILDDTIAPTPVVNVADGFTTAVVGQMDYSFGNFKLNVTVPLTRVDGGLQREVTRPPSDHELVVGTYNVENLDPGDGAAFARHAQLIVDHLRSPDLIAIEEIQDNDGAANTNVTDASATWSALIAAIQAAGGPAYEFRQIDPVDDQDGGEPGGNIRVGFLYRTDRGLSFVDRPGGDSATPTTVVDHPSGPRLSFSPGRVDPQDPAWASTRKPLAGEFQMRGKKVFVIANHFSSKGGDQPLFGRFQPPARSSEVARHAQARSVNDFVDAILAADPQANVIVLGDINDFEFSETVEILTAGGVLTSLMETLPKPERYSYVFEGNSQVLDQILVSTNLLGNFPIDYDPVHVNAEFADQASDHDPQVARLDLGGRPTRK